MSSSHTSGDDGSNNSSGGYSKDEPSQGPASYAAQSYSTSDKMLGQLGITPKTGPAYDGTTSWFEYEQLIDDRCDITTLDEEKRRPSLKTKLSGIASMQKEALDRTKLASKSGVECFKKKMHPFFVKGERFLGTSSAFSRRGGATKTS